MLERRDDQDDQQPQGEANWYLDAVTALEQGNDAKGLFIAFSDPDLYERLERKAEERRNNQEW